MGFLSPITALIAAGITVPLLVALYFLKLRRRQVMISSTLLWKKAIQDMQVNSPFQKLRRSLLLLLQLLILGALLFAMARPTMQATAAPGQRVVIVIDHSASMNATDISPTRLDEAKKAALELIGNLDAGGDEPGGSSQGAPGQGAGVGGPSGGVSGGASGSAAGGAMVVSFAQNARVCQTFTNDLVRLRDAVRGIEPTDQVSDLGPALRLVEPFANKAMRDDVDSLVVYVISDGRVLMDGAAMSLSGAQLRYVPIGGGGGAPDADNVGIVSFSARRDFDKPEIVQVFARVANFGQDRVRANLTLSLDGRVTRVQPITLSPAPVASTPAPGSGSSLALGADSTAPPDAPTDAPTDSPPTLSPTPGPAGSETSVQFDFVLPGSALVELSHDHEDQLAADNAARLTLAPARRLRVLMVTRGNTYLDHGIRSAGVRQLVAMSPDKFEDQDPTALRRGGWDASGASGLAGEGFDVIVFDGYAPKATPLVDSLYFGAVPPIEGLQRVPSREGEPTLQRILDWVRDHPLLRYVVLDDVILTEPGRLEVPPQAVVLMTGQSGPLMAEVVHEGVRHVATSFDVLHSNWPLSVGFPVFLSNTVQTLGLGGLSGEAGVFYHTGEVAVVPADAEGALVYKGPVRLTVNRTTGAAVLPAFTRAGVYQTDAGIDPPFDRISVNLLDANESDVRTADLLMVSTVAGDAQAQPVSIRREVWRWFIWGALAVMMIEWLVYTRRMHL